MIFRGTRHVWLEESQITRSNCDCGEIGSCLNYATKFMSMYDLYTLVYYVLELKIKVRSP